MRKKLYNKLIFILGFGLFVYCSSMISACLKRGACSFNPLYIEEAKAYIVIALFVTVGMAVNVFFGKNDDMWDD